MHSRLATKFWWPGIYKDTKEFPSGYDLELGWSYYVAVAGTIFTCLSVFTTGFEAYLLKNRGAGYENI